MRIFSRWYSPHGPVELRHIGWIASASKQHKTFVGTQEEKDYLEGLALIYGFEVQLNIYQGLHEFEEIDLWVELAE